MLTFVESLVTPTPRPIRNAEEFRGALERLRRMEVGDEDYPRGRERSELEIEICRYLASRELRVR